MNILVYDIAAENGGALEILYQFYEEYKLDKCNNYYFIVSNDCLESLDNIIVLSYPWIKKSWMHRIMFDLFYIGKLIKLYKIDKFISLQNNLPSAVNVPSSTYFHNILPFSTIKFKLYDDPILWTYQNIISKIYFKSLKRSDEIIVQTNWIRKVISSKLDIDIDRFQVKFPNINIETKKHYKKEKIRFFYPASSAKFKNHKMIIDALLKIDRKKYKNFKIFFTLNGNETRHISKLNLIIKKYDLPVYFIGYIDKNSIYDYLSNSILIFPSLIETIGLPLLEAKKIGSPIIVADTPYAHETLSDYENAIYFSTSQIDELVDVIMKYLY